MTAAMSSPTRVFVSHSHADNEYCRAFVNGLREAGVEVWYDEHNMGWGALREVIDRELQASDHFIAILTPSAVTSNWVNSEIDAALYLLAKGTIRTVLFVTAERCDISPVLQRYKRIERPDGTGFPPAEAVTRVLLVTKPRPIILAQSHVPPSQSTKAPPSSPPPTIPSSPSGGCPPRLAGLGFSAYRRDSVEYLLPPCCDIPAGGFLMGSDLRRDKDAFDDEEPRHAVTLPAYQISRFPVTVAEYACAVRAGVVPEPPQKKPGVVWLDQLTRLDHPVVRVTWHDASTYAAWLAKLTGQPWRLPTEAEWERAARWDPSARKARLYPWGDIFDASRCNTHASHIYMTTPIDSFPAGNSPCGALDMIGNVLEWTRSLHMAYPYMSNDGRESADSTKSHVQRGGWWGCEPRFARAACRHNYEYSGEHFNDFFDYLANSESGTGFRLVV